MDVPAVIEVKDVDGGVADRWQGLSRSLGSGLGVGMIDGGDNRSSEAPERSEVDISGLGPAGDVDAEDVNVARASVDPEKKGRKN